MGFVSVVPLGRSSSLFFQGLFDGHPCFVTLPTFWYPTVSWLNGKSPRALARWIYRNQLKKIFDFSSVRVSIPYSRFEAAFCEYLGSFGITPKTVFLAVHYGYLFARSINAASVKYLVFQAHDVFTQHRTVADFPNQKIFFMVRDPRATYASLKSIDPFTAPLAAISLFYFGYAYSKKYHCSGQALYISHEELHTRFESTMRCVLRFLGVPMHPHIRQSSFFGRPFTGNAVRFPSGSGINASKPNPAYVSNRWSSVLSRFEVRFVNWFGDSYLRQFGYRQTSAGNTDRFFFDSAFTASAKSFFTISSPSALKRSVRRFVRLLISLPFLGRLFLPVAAFSFYVFSYLGMYIKFFSAFRK